MIEGIKNFFKELGDIVDSGTVLGEPVQAGGATLIPVISFKAGAGSCNGKDVVGGSGGGINIEPRALVVIKNEEVRVYTFHHRDTVNELSEAVPELSRLWAEDSYDNM